MAIDVDGGGRDGLVDRIGATALVFLTRGQCTQCHSGDLFSDLENYDTPPLRGLIQVSAA